MSNGERSTQRVPKKVYILENFETNLRKTFFTRIIFSKYRLGQSKIRTAENLIENETYPAFQLHCKNPHFTNSCGSCTILQANPRFVTLRKFLTILCKRLSSLLNLCGFRVKRNRFSSRTAYKKERIIPEDTLDTCFKLVSTSLLTLVCTFQDQNEDLSLKRR